MAVHINQYDDEDGFNLEIVGDKGHRFGFTFGDTLHDCGWFYIQNRHSIR